MLFQEKQQIVLCAAAAVIVAGFVLLRYLPLHKRIRGIEQAKAAQTSAITKAQRQSERLPRLKEQLLKLRVAVENYQANIPAQRDLGFFLQQVANLMNDHNLKEQLVQPREEIETDRLNCIPVDIQCKGQLIQVFEFYKSLQKLDRRVRVEQVKLVNDNDFSGEVSMQTKAIIYYKAKAGQG